MLLEPIYLRFENTSPPHHKFYEMEVELSLFFPKRLIRRWGRIGSRRPRAIRMVMYTPDELVHQMESLARLRQRHGYQTVSEIKGSAIAASAA